MVSTVIPDSISFLAPRHLVHVLSIVQFGSSLYSPNPGDIDLCVVTKKDAFFDFLANEPFVLKPGNIDVSLVRQEEMSTSADFRFGSHGAHLLLSLREGDAVYGENIFLELPPPSSETVKTSILDRLYDYLYEVRKLESLNSRDESGLQKRWPKFQRLSLFLLGTKGEYGFPSILTISDAELEAGFAQYGLHYESNFTPVGFEHIWEAILKKNSQS